MLLTRNMLHNHDSTKKVWDDGLRIYTVSLPASRENRIIFAVWFGIVLLSAKNIKSPLFDYREDITRSWSEEWFVNKF